MWECDYPHSDSTWPTAPEALTKSLDGVSDHDIDRITHLNAMKHFHYDPFTTLGGKENCTVGALRQQVVGPRRRRSARSSGTASPSGAPSQPTCSTPPRSRLRRRPAAGAVATSHTTRRETPSHGQSTLRLPRPRGRRLDLRARSRRRAGRLGRRRHQGRAPRDRGPAAGPGLDGPDPRRRQARSTTSSSSPTGASAASASTSAPTAGGTSSTSWPRPSDVFLTSFLPAVRQRLKIDVEHIRAVNPDIVYARGSGPGPARPRPREARLRRLHLLGPGWRSPTPSPRRTASGPSADGRPSATWPGAWPSPAGSPPACCSGPPPARHRSSTCRCWAWPCGCSPRTSWPPASTAATRCPSSTGAPRPTRWSATTGPATTGSSP